VEQATARFDADAAPFKSATPVSAARAALAEQLQRALYGPYRKQLAALQRMTLSKFNAKVQGQKPTADVEEQLALLVKEALAAFDASAQGLLPSGVRWTYSYERASVLTAMREAAALHVQTLQVQGLYLSKAGHSIPVDFAAHWLLPHPFGRDSRSDPISSADEPAYRPQASLMRLKATDGYKPGSKLRDPDRKRMEEVKRYTKDMVFTDKMMS